MKKRALFTAICAVLICAVFMLSGCFIRTRHMIKYYGDDENYITEKGKVEAISYYLNDLWLSLSNGYFRITESNEKVLRANDFYVDVRLDSEITYTTAPAIFGDGYDPPIVAIEYNGKTYLDFETGKNNLLEYLRG